MRSSDRPWFRAFKFGALTTVIVSSLYFWIISAAPIGMGALIAILYPIPVAILSLPLFRFIIGQTEWSDRKMFQVAVPLTVIGFLLFLLSATGSSEGQDASISWLLKYRFKGDTMHMLCGTVMTAIGLFFLVCATTRSDLYAYRLLVARSQLFWRDRVHFFHQMVGLVLMVLGLLWAFGIIWTEV